MAVGVTQAFLLGGTQQLSRHTETLHGVAPGLIIVRVATVRRPLGTFHQLHCRHRDIATAKQNIESYLLLVFSAERVDGFPEELCSLVPARVRQ